MKILLLAQSFPPPAAAGSAQYIANIFSALPPQTAVIMTGDAEPAHAKEFDAKFPQRILRFPFILHVATGYKASKIARVREYLLWPLAAGWVLWREKPDVVMIGEFNVATITVLIAKLLFHIPYVLFTYAEELTYISGRPIYLRLLKNVLRNADVIVTVSDFTKTILEGLGAPAARIHKILPAVAEDKIRVDAGALAALRMKYSLDGRHILLTAGRLVERKGHASVIEALPVILQTLPSVSYVIVGAGPEEEKLRNLVQGTGMQKHVVFTGRVDDSELACWYEICDLFVMPHRDLPDTRETEGCPTVFLEAGAHGKAVIGGKDGGVTDAILQDRTGFIIDGTNTAKLAETVCYLLNNSEVAAKMGAEGRAYAATLDSKSRAAAVWNISLQHSGRR